MTDSRPGRGVDLPTPLLLLARKYLVGARVGPIEQPEDERTLSISLIRADRRFGLIIELIGRYSNVVLVDEQDEVMDALKRIGPEQNRVRVTLPHHKYVAPPSQQKQSVRQAGDIASQEFLAQVESGEPIWKSLVAQVKGLSPVIARELCQRSVGHPLARLPAEPGEQVATIQRVLGAVADLAAVRREHRWEPGFSGDGSSPVAFAPIRLSHLGTWTATASISQAAEQFYSEQSDLGAVGQARKRLNALIAAERAILQRKHESLSLALTRAGDPESLRAAGEVVLAYATQIPRSAASWTAHGIEVSLEPDLTPVENAQKIFQRYRKAKAALAEVPRLIGDVENRLRYLEQLDTLSSIADDSETIRGLADEIRVLHADKSPQRTRRQAKRAWRDFLRFDLPHGKEALIGRSAQENDRLTFKIAGPDDLWLHARGMPGAHVIIRDPGQSPSPQAIEAAAALAAYYSAGRQQNRVPVDWSRRKHVRSLGLPGLVRYSHEETITVRPHPPAPELLGSGNYGRVAP